MESSDAIQLIILVILLGLSAFFSSAETSLTTVNRIRIAALAEEKNQRAIICQKVISNSSKMLSAILIGNNLVNILASSLATTLAMRFLGNAAVGIATGVLTLLVLIFGEITPKTLASIHNEKLALSYARIIWFLMKALTPVIFIVNLLCDGVLRLLHVDKHSRVSSMTENELRIIVDNSLEDGVIEREEREMIHNVVDFGDSQAKDIMIPRIDMTTVDINDSYDTIYQRFHEDKFTRLPIYEDSKDHIVGIINFKDFIFHDWSDGFEIRKVAYEPYFTYEFKKTADLMIEMRKERQSIAIVLNEYGEAAGMITLEDLLEEIVGEIRDEFDEDEEEAIQKTGDREYLVDGGTKLDDLNDALKLHFSSEDYDSIGGLMIELLDHLPKEGEQVITEDQILLTIASMDNHRVEKVALRLPEASDNSSEIKKDSPDPFPTGQENNEQA